MRSHKGARECTLSPLARGKRPPSPQAPMPDKEEVWTMLSKELAGLTVRHFHVGMIRLTGPAFCVSLSLELLACGEADGELPRINDPSANPPRPDATVEWYRGAPDGANPMQRTPVSVSRLADGSAMQITVWGSSSCPPAGTRALLSEDRRSVTLILRSYHRPCTTDVSPTTSVVRFADDAESSGIRRIIVKQHVGPAMVVHL